MESLLELRLESNRLNYLHGSSLFPSSLHHIEERVKRGRNRLARQIAFFFTCARLSRTRDLIVCSEQKSLQAADSRKSGHAAAAAAARIQPSEKTRLIKYPGESERASCLLTAARRSLRQVVRAFILRPIRAVVLSLVAGPQLALSLSCLLHILQDLNPAFLRRVVRRRSRRNRREPPWAYRQALICAEVPDQSDLPSMPNITYYTSLQADFNTTRSMLREQFF